MKKTFLILVLFALFLNGCSLSSYEVSDYKMGTIVTLKISGADGKKCAEELFEYLGALESKYSVKENMPDNIIKRINENAGKSAVIIDDETMHIIKKSLFYSQVSGGLFDITAFSAVKLWDIGGGNQRVPEKKEITEAKKFINYKNIIITEETNEIYLKEKTGIDLGGILKGYAADKCIEIIRNNYKNIDNAIINIGGNVYTYNKNNQKLFQVGLENPFKQNEIYAKLSLSNKTIVTSGSYQRYFEENNKLYHHIIDPRTGYPSENELVSATVISDSSIDADALSTACFIMGKEEGLKLAEKLGFEVIFVTKNKEIFTTNSIKSQFSLLDNSFFYKN